MATIEFVDQTIRDGQQSWWGLRLKTGMVAEVARELDQAGFHRIDVTGSTMFECVLRYCRENPWEGLDLWRKWMPRTKFRAGTRHNCIAKFGLTPDSLMELWVRTLVKHGIDSFWLYDCLYDMDRMRWMAKTISDCGAEVVGALMYGISPVHTDEFFAARVREMVSWGTVSGIYFEDAPGILTPERAETLIPAIVEAARGLPLEMHCHSTTGLAPVNYLVAIRHGCRIIHTASEPLANGPSLPSTEGMLANIRRLGHDSPLDDRVLPVIAQHCRRIAAQEGFPMSRPNEYSVFPYQHQMPGGMTGTLRGQLAQYDMEDRLDEVLEETVRVREDLGHPISATPFSQLMGIQAVLNVVTGRRYGVVPDEVILYTLGHLGTPPCPIDPDVKDAILSTPRGQELLDWEPPQPSLRELRRDYGGEHISDEELILRYLVPAEDFAAAMATGPVSPTYELHEGPAQLVHRLLALTTPSYLHVARGGLALTLRRRS